jgi:hypothetical protein
LKKTKNHGPAGTVIFGMPIRLQYELDSRLAQRFNALGAPHLLDRAPVFQDRNLLQIRFPLSIGGALRERATMPEGGSLAAISTLRHRKRSFQMIPERFLP